MVEINNHIGPKLRQLDCPDHSEQAFNIRDYKKVQAVVIGVQGGLCVSVEKERVQEVSDWYGQLLS